MKTIDYFVVPSSPWAYLGHARFVGLARRHDARIHLKPFDLGRVFPLSGGLPLPKRAPQRQAYRLIELERWSRHLGVALNRQPKHFPVAADPAALAIIAVERACGTDAALTFTAGVMAALWAHERDIADPSVLVSIADDAGLDGARLVAQSDAARPEYERNTQQAIDAGVFGAPWYVYRGEPFWGQDRLDFVERALASA